MCGIFGVFNFQDHQPVDHSLIKQATTLIEHRGPDGEGFYFDDLFGVGFGHRRLSILDLNTGAQPMSNEDGTVWITFNGEIYNYQEIRKYLTAKSHKFKTNSDTEVIVHAYEEFGEECTKQFNGIFAFAIWDKKNRKMFLARDHFGVKPLYYSINNGQLIFASEIKSILLYSKSKPPINTKALNYCFTFRHTPAPFTLFEGINKLPASHLLKIGKDGKPVLNNYWDATIEIDRKKTEDEWIEILRTEIEAAVQKQMMADVPVGISLSGGVDSGSVLSLMSKYQGKGVHAFTVSFEDSRIEDDEFLMAKKNAEMFGAKFYHSVVSIEDYSKFMDKYIWHLEEPIGNESAVAYYFVANMAKGIVKVLLNGQGADEPFAGYDRYLGMYYSDKFKIIPPSFFNLLSNFTSDLNKKNQLYRFSQFIKEKDFYSKAANIASILSKEQRHNLFSDTVLKTADTNDYQLEVKKIINDKISGSDLEKYLFYDMFSSLSENLLLCEDKMAMAASIEARVPFLDIELVKTALSIPANKKIKNGKLKYIHKKVCEKYLPNAVVYQRKIGFSNPVDKWLTSSLGNELADYINSSNSITNLFLKKNAILNFLEEHRSKKYDHQRFLYLLLSIEKWKNTFL